MGTESIIYVLVGICWIAGTVYLYLFPEPDSPGIKPLGSIRSEDFMYNQRDLRLCIGI